MAHEHTPGYTSTERPLRILHVVGALTRAGTEKWLLGVLRHIDRERFRIDFLVHTTQPAAYDDEVRALGSKVLPCPNTSRPRAYAHDFRRILREHGPYDMVHSHVHHFSGYVLRLAHQAGVPIRIAHSHTTHSPLDSKSWPRRLYVTLAERWIAQHATVGLAASRPAARALFGPNWQADPRWRVLYCGIDVEAFRSPVGIDTVRTELGFSPDDLVIGHVGRFTELKNHRLIVRIAAEVAQREPRARFLFVGDGGLRPEIERLVAQEGLSERIRIVGAHPDVPRLMVGAMDLFLFPSMHEGLGLVLIEAQAAGLPCVVSSVVPEEAYVLPSLVHPISLEEPVSIWADSLLSIAAQPCTLSRQQALDRVARSPFAIETSTRELADFYVSAWATSHGMPTSSLSSRRTSDAYH